MGGAEATVTVEAEGRGVKTAQGGGEAEVVVSAEGAGWHIRKPRGPIRVVVADMRRRVKVEDMRRQVVVRDMARKVVVLLGAGIKVGSTGPPLTVICYDADGTPVNFTGDKSVQFRMEERYRKTAVDAAAEFDGPRTNGQLRYVWKDGDTDGLEKGKGKGEFVVTRSDDTIERFPSKPGEFIEIDIGRAIKVKP